MDDRVAFSFLNETKKEILKEYSVDELLNTNSSQLNKGKEILKKKWNIIMLNLLRQQMVNLLKI